MSRKSKGKMVTKMKPSSRKNQGFGFAPLDKNISKILKPIFFKKKDDFLIINNLNKIDGLKKYGITDVQKVSMPVFTNSHNKSYLATKRDRLHHTMPKDT